MTFGSLFSGFGGMDLGLTRAGMNCAWQVEKDGYARQVLDRHFPDVRRHDDVRTFPPDGPEGWSCDLICGGDPCQGNSKAGGVWKRRPDADLAPHFIRIIDAIRPRVVLRENPSEARSDAPGVWWRVRRDLESIGYAVLPFRLRACCVGLDHRRERLFLLAALPDADGERLERLDREGFAAWDAGRGGRGRGRDAGDHGLPFPGVRRIADGFSGGMVRRRLTGLGNAVPPAMAEWIGRSIMDSFN